MGRVRVLRWYNNVSIAKKLYFAVGIMALLIAIELFTLWFAISTLSSLRAYVSGEGLWSKGQKDAIYYLGKYGRSHKEEDYKSFQKFMLVPMGDHKARVELLKPNPNFEIARQGFIEGRNHPDDIDGMIMLIRRFHSNYYIAKAIDLWAAADPLISELTPIGAQLHQEIISPTPSQAKIDAYMAQIENLNDKLTVLEDAFSYTLGEASRWLEHLVLRLLFGVALTVEVTGLILTISVSRAIQKGLNEIIDAAKAIAKGDFSRRAKAFSNDEIGILANSFNQMTEELERSHAAMKEYSRKLEHSNNSLEQFAYVASHDLQEPLRTVTNFAGLLEQKHKGKLDPTSENHLSYVISGANKMKALVKDMLHYSRLGKFHAVESVDCNKVVAESLVNMELLLQETGTTVHVNELPVIQFTMTEMLLVFQNLINNAIKYRKLDVPPVISINCKKLESKGWLFSVSDNGIGFDNSFKEKIFIIFQRLHNDRDYSGTGIGLATCKKIVEMNGGTIWVDSEPGEGSTFFFTLVEPTN